MPRRSIFSIKNLVILAGAVGILLSVSLVIIKISSNKNSTSGTATFQDKLREADEKQLAGDLEGSQKALEGYASDKDPKIRASALMAIGAQTLNSGKYKEAREYYYKAEQAAEGSSELSGVYQAIGFASEKLEDYTEAIKYYQKYVDVQKASQDPFAQHAATHYTNKVNALKEKVSQ